MRITVKQIPSSVWVLNDYDEDDGTIKFHCSHSNHEIESDYSENDIWVTCNDQDCQGITEREQEDFAMDFDWEDFFNVRNIGRSL